LQIIYTYKASLSSSVNLINWTQKKPRNDMPYQNKKIDYLVLHLFQIIIEGLRDSK
jgi:hypothetical protein